MATATGGIPIIAFLNEEYNLSEIFDGRLKFEFVDIPVPTFDVTHIYWDHLTANIVEDVLIALWSYKLPFNEMECTMIFDPGHFHGELLEKSIRYGDHPKTPPGQRPRADTRGFRANLHDYSLLVVSSSQFEAGRDQLSQPRVQDTARAERWEARREMARAQLHLKLR